MPDDELPRSQAARARPFQDRFEGVESRFVAGCCDLIMGGVLGGM
jgi:hypothetical protein